MALRRSKKVVVDEGIVEGPAHVLVVHDDEDGCELLVRILAAVGHRVDRAHDAGEAAQVLQDGDAPACVVIDIGGGVASSLSLVDSVRNHSDPAVAGARVVLITSGPSSAVFSWQAGIDELLARPFHADELITAVAESLARPESDRRHHRRRMLESSRR